MWSCWCEENAKWEAHRSAMLYILVAGGLFPMQFKKWECEKRSICIAKLLSKCISPCEDHWAMWSSGEMQASLVWVALCAWRSPQCAASPSCRLLGNSSSMRLSILLSRWAKKVCRALRPVLPEYWRDIWSWRKLLLQLVCSMLAWTHTSEAPALFVPETLNVTAGIVPFSPASGAGRNNFLFSPHTLNLY